MVMAYILRTKVYLTEKTEMQNIIIPILFSIPKCDYTEN